MKRPLEIFFLLLAVGLLALSLFDSFVWRVSPTVIYEGQAFLYFAHVDVLARAPYALLGLLCLSLWIFLRKLVPLLDYLHPLTMLLVCAAWGFFTLISPLARITQIARTVQAVETPTAVYRLYYQYEGIGNAYCDYVLVRCEGLMCHYQARWRYDVCLGTFVPLNLEQVGQEVHLIEGDELIFRE